MPKVSIILPTYNGQEFIKESIESIISQSFKDWELIIVNDCSSDNTPQIISNYEKKDSRIKVINNATNKKLPATLNTGFKNASGTFLTWTSDDNIYSPNAIEKMVKKLEDNSDIDLVYANQYSINEEGKVFNKKPHNSPDKLFDGCCIGACFMYRKSVYVKYGEYREDLFCAEDYEFWLRLYTNNVKFYQLKEFLYYYRTNPQSLTATKQELIQRNTSEVKLSYWDSFNISNFKKCKSLFKQYKRTKSKEILNEIFKKSPIWGRTFYILKYIR